jgi:hypothetical protein
MYNAAMGARAAACLSDQALHDSQGLLFVPCNLSCDIINGFSRFCSIYFLRKLAPFGVTDQVLFVLSTSPHLMCLALQVLALAG